MTKLIVIYSPGLNKLLIVELDWSKVKIVTNGEVKKGTYLYIGDFN